MLGGAAAAPACCSACRRRGSPGPEVCANRLVGHVSRARADRPLPRALKSVRQGVRPPVQELEGKRHAAECSSPLLSRRAQIGLHGAFWSPDGAAAARWVAGRGEALPLFTCGGWHAPQPRSEAVRRPERSTPTDAGRRHAWEDDRRRYRPAVPAALVRLGGFPTRNYQLHGCDAKPGACRVPNTPFSEST